MVQIYTGFIYRGPALVREAVAAIAELDTGRDRKVTVRKVVEP